MHIGTDHLQRHHTSETHHLQHHRDLQHERHHRPRRSGCPPASWRPLSPDTRHHGRLSPAALLLNSYPRPPPHLPPPAFALRGHKTNMDGLHNLLRPS